MYFHRGWYIIALKDIEDIVFMQKILHYESHFIELNTIDKLFIPLNKTDKCIVR